jgi:PAS domain S-box-containing protein
MKVIFLTSSAPADDGAIADRLALAATELEIMHLDSPAAALDEIRRGGDWMALMISPRVPQADALELIEILRREATPIAVVPLVTSVQQGFIASALAAGADDVLMVQSQSIVNLPRTLARIRQSPHLRPTGNRRRLRTLYVGEDQVVWTTLSQISFVGAEKVTPGADGVTPLRTAESGAELRFDVIVVDEHSGGAAPLQVLNSLRAQAPDLPVVMLTSPASGDFETEALDLGANATLVKTGMFRRRLVATLRNVHQRLELVEQHEELRSREARLRQIVETLPVSVVIISADDTVLAINAAAQSMIGATRRSAIVGQPFTSLVGAEHRGKVMRTLHDVTEGTASTVEFEVLNTDGSRRTVQLNGVLLERDARGSRGVIAVMQPPPAPAQVAPSAEHVAAVAAAETARRDAERRHQELTTAIAAERETWQAERSRLQVELAEAKDLLDAERDGRASAERAVRDARASAERDLAAVTSQHGDAVRAAADDQRAIVERLEDALAAVEAERAAAVAELAKMEEERRDAASAPAAPAEPPLSVSQLEAVGRLTTAITPEIETVMTAIHGAGGEIAALPGVADDTRDQARLIVTRAKRAGLLLRQLQKFGVKHSQPPAPVELDGLVRRIQPLLAQLAGAHIEFEVVAGSTGSVVASQDDLEQLATAVVVAVRDLLPMGGALTLETTSHDATLVLSAVASGYGVQPAQSTVALDTLAQRCGGSLEVVDEEGRAGLRVAIAPVADAVSATASTAA